MMMGIECSFCGKWIIDSGSAFDLIKTSRAEKQFKCILQDSGKAHFDTANLRTASNDRVGIFIEEMPTSVKPWLVRACSVGAVIGQEMYAGWV